MTLLLHLHVCWDVMLYQMCSSQSFKGTVPLYSVSTSPRRITTACTCSVLYTVMKVGKENRGGELVGMIVTFNVWSLGAGVQLGWGT
jgi:hypothetical protein